jgi:hypothetical protein
MTMKSQGDWGSFEDIKETNLVIEHVLIIKLYHLYLPLSFP